MTRFRALMVGAAIAALAFTAGAVAQQNVTNRSNSGNEVITAAQGGPGGPSIFVTIGQLRNGMNMTSSALTSGTVSLTPAVSGIILTGAATSGLTINLPPSPWDGQTVEVINGTGSGFVSAPAFAVTDGSTLVNCANATTLASGGSRECRYLLATNSWYGMR